MPKLPKLVITFKLYQLHAKISTPTVTAIPVKKSQGNILQWNCSKLQGKEITDSDFLKRSKGSKEIVT